MDFSTESYPFGQRATPVCVHLTTQHLCNMPAHPYFSASRTLDNALISTHHRQKLMSLLRRQDPLAWEQAFVGQVEIARTWTRRGRGLVGAHIVSTAPTSHPMLLRTGRAIFVDLPSTRSRGYRTQDRTTSCKVRPCYCTTSVRKVMRDR